MIITAVAAKIVPMILVLFATMIVLMVFSMTLPAKKIDESNVGVDYFFMFFTDGIFNEIDYTFQVLIYELIQT
jgi:hypothetical protein